MTPEQFRSLYPLIIRWIRQTLAAHSRQAHSVASLRFPHLSGFYSEELLTSAKAVTVPKVPVPPLSSLGLAQFVEFERGNFAGVTYLDTFFVRSDRAEDEVLYFHEMIHVVQWRLLGPERFLANYATGLETSGYRNSPLEVMAYDAGERFVTSTAAFDAEKLVAEELNKMGLI